MSGDTLNLKRAVTALVLFGISFGYVEAAVVVYLRGFLDPLHARLYPERTAGDLFPMVTLDQLRSADPDGVFRLQTEVGREFATLVMLAAFGMAVGRNARQGFAAFVVAFGVWDLAFYAWLKVLIDWPASLFTWDLLFLIPVPWTGPVLAPALVAVSMIVTGCAVLAREARGEEFLPKAVDWGVICAGGVVVVVAFCWDASRVMAGGAPERFPWVILVVGEGMGLAGFFRAYCRRRAQSPT